MRSVLPASEGDLLAFIGYLSLEGRISDTSLPQYVSDVSRLHFLNGLPSPTTTPLIKSLMHAYSRKYQTHATARTLRTGCSATVMRRILDAGLDASEPLDILSCATSVFAFVFHCRSVSFAFLKPEDVLISPSEVTGTLFRRKGKSTLRPLILRYPSYPDETSGRTPAAILSRWSATRPSGPGFFSSSLIEEPTAISLNKLFRHALRLAQSEAPDGYFYSGHSPLIGSYNELALLQYSRAFIMRRLDWESETMLRVYLDTRLSLSPHSSWFFAHLRAPAG